MKEYSSTNLKKFAYDIYTRLDDEKKTVFLCVGSDKFVCDSLGPIIGEKLIKKYNVEAYVYGNLDYNINAQNLNSAINYIEIEHSPCQIILIDATLNENVGNAIVSEGSFAGMGKLLPIRKIGNFSILGVVGKKTKTFDLNATKLKIVLDLSNFISKGIAMAVSEKLRRKIIRLKNLDKVEDNNFFRQKSTK